MNIVPELPFRIIMITTGLSGIVKFLCHSNYVHVVGIIDCSTTEDSCVAYARKLNIPYCIYKDMKYVEGYISSLKPDMIIIHKLPFLLPECILGIPPMGIINIHPSLLPKYRGANPWFWIYYNMEPFSGVSIHRVDKYADHGDILLQATFMIELGSSLHTLQKRVENCAIDLLTQLFINWDTIVPKPQEMEIGTECGSCIDVNRLIDIRSMNIVRLWHILRGFPWILEKICPDSGNRKFQVGNFRYCNVNQVDIGHLIRVYTEDYLVCKEGVVELIRPVSCML